MNAGVLTAPELALLRTRPQRTQLYLAIPEYKTIYTARANGVPSTNDNVISVAFDGGAGTLANVLLGMTLLVGTSAGAWDIGIARIRSYLDTGGGTGYFLIGITSEIEWIDNLYLTVVDDYGLWPRHPFIDPAEVLYMDYDIAYTNQNVYGDPIPIMGTHAVVEAGATVHFDASDSYTCIGTPDHYDFAWYVDGVLTSNADNVDIAFASPGTYLIKLEVTADYAIGSPVIEKTSVAYRYVIVYDKAHPLNASFTLESCSGNYDNGGWSYRVTMNARASESYVRDRTLCLLVARDWYGDTEQSIGPLEGRENIVCVGWVDGESITRSNDLSTVSFEVQGPTFWLGVQEGFPTGIDDTDVAPTDWPHIEQLDPRKGLFSFLHWRTTATSLLDCYITNDTHRLATTYTPAGSLLEQLRAICDRINAKAVCDRYGRLFCEIDTQFISPASRAFPIVQTLIDRDWRDEIIIERRTVPAAGQVDLSGIYYSGDFATSNAIFSLAPGHYPKHYGTKHKVERIALTNQAEANTLAGLWLGYLNNEYPNIDILMSSAYRVADIAPRMFVQMNLAAGDTPRGIEWTYSFVPAPKKLIPRQVTFGYDPREALMLTDINFEAEAFPSGAIVGDPPIEPPDPITWPIPPIIYPTPDPVLADVVVVITTSHIGRSLDFYTADPPTDVHWDDISAGLPVGCLMYDLQIGGSEGWLIVIDAGAYDLYYCADLLATAPMWTLALSEAAARGYANVWAGHHSKAMAVTDAGVCYLAAQLNVASTTLSYWRCVAGAVAGFESVTGVGSGSCTGDSPADAACDDGTDVYLSCENPVMAGSIAWISPTLGTSGAIAAIRTAYAISSANLVAPPDIMYTLAGALVQNDVKSNGQVVEMTGHTFWIRDTDQFLMIDAAIQAVPNDADGGVGTFSAAGATGSIYYEFGLAGYGEILWTAQSAAGVNSKRSIAYTSNGGVTWETRDGDWSTVFGAYEGGNTTMIRTSQVSVG